MVEKGSFKRKIVRLSVALVIGVAICIIGYLVYCKTLFYSIDRRFFRTFVNNYPQERKDEYKIHSLDAYYYRDKSKQQFGVYYYNLKYTFYFEPDDKWFEIDEVSYGNEGSFPDLLYLNWPEEDLEHYKEDIEAFENAKKNGIHKAFTAKDIEKWLDKGYKGELD